MDSINWLNIMCFYIYNYNFLFEQIWQPDATMLEQQNQITPAIWWNHLISQEEIRSTISVICCSCTISEEYMFTRWIISMTLYELYQWYTTLSVIYCSLQITAAIWWNRSCLIVSILLYILSCIIISQEEIRSTISMICFSVIC